MMPRSADVTALARKAGWGFDNLTVTAQVEPDDHTSVKEFDCYTPKEIAAWYRSEWHYVGVTVTITDRHGNVWGESSLWGVEYGRYTDTDENDTVTGTRDIDPLTGDYPVPDLIAQAFADVRQRLANLPVITSTPTGDKS